ncbi:MAG: glycosyltransferase family 1 protein [Patescibacteria group bacterium]
MHIGIPLSPYGEKSPSGLGIFVLSVVHVLIKLKPDWSFTLITKGIQNSQEFSQYKNVSVVAMPNHFLWKDVACATLKEVDVWLYVNPSLPFLVTPLKSLAIALDFGNFYDDQNFNFSTKIKIGLLKKVQGWSLRRASHIVSTSQATLTDMQKIFPVTIHKKSSVVMCGYTKVSEVYQSLKVENLPEEYYLIVGVIKPRKNQLTAVKAFFTAKEQGLKAKLVICGKGSGEYYDALISYIAQSPHKEDVLFLGYRTNEELTYLYKHALALVFPSHVEGFGMPIVEAMSCGTPVICSNNGAQGEVANGYAITIDSRDVSGFSNAMITMQNQEVRTEYIQKGYVRAEDFSWEKTGRGYISILESM